MSDFFITTPAGYHTLYLKRKTFWPWLHQLSIFFKNRNISFITNSERSFILQTIIF